jgi:hypothetical protein
VRESEPSADRAQEVDRFKDQSLFLLSFAMASSSSTFALIFVVLLTGKKESRKQKAKDESIEGRKERNRWFCFPAKSL